MTKEEYDNLSEPEKMLYDKIQANLKAKQKKEYKVQVIRTYSVLDVITVEAVSDADARIVAEDESSNKDYTGQLHLEDVELTIIE